jgi:elongation factor 1 alpha-like protein
MMGHLAQLLGIVSERQITKLKKQAEVQQKQSFHYAWVLDQDEEERARGVTIDLGFSNFATPKFDITLMDAPGHVSWLYTRSTLFQRWYRELRQISGASQADAGILVINASKGEFERGFDRGGQTREHALLLKSLGVSQIIVCINKMDTVCPIHISWIGPRRDLKRSRRF